MVSVTVIILSVGNMRVIIGDASTAIPTAHGMVIIIENRMAESNLLITCPLFPWDIDATILGIMEEDKATAKAVGRFINILYSPV